MPRFFLDPAAWTDEAALSGDEAKHCSRVLRAKVGDFISVFDGEGRSAEAEIRSVARDRVALRLGEFVVEPPPAVEVVLAQAVIKGKAMDWLLQKAVELGVSGIQPLATRHAVVHPGEGKEEKWQRVVLESCKQCGRSRMPRVSPVLEFGDFLKKTPRETRIIASLEAEAKPLRGVLSKMEGKGKLIVLVGPEGDFSPEEYAASLDFGCLPVSLGSAVLRSETAAIYCLSAATYAFS